ncbi:MAG TPA: PqqD family protein [Gaiellaceae bacterium]|nr:PqqD family protein [Gaiellaceae bacterium]
MARVIDGDAVVIDTITGRYYSLEGPSETAWSLLVASASLAEIAAAMRERFDVGEADVPGDLERLASELVAENLLRPTDSPGEKPEPYDGEKAPYVTPTVTVFHDMEELLAFDPPLPVADVSVWTAERERP